MTRPTSRSLPLCDWFAGSRAAWVLIWLAFVLPRAALILLDVTPTSDADWYFDHGADFAAGRGHLDNQGGPTAYWPPGWPMILSVAFRLFGASVTTVGLLNLALAALGGWLLYSLAKRIFGGEATGRLALLLYAIYPNAVGYVPLALTEVAYTTLLLAICWLLVSERVWWRFILAGLLLGLASLVKAQSLAVVPLILAIDLLRERGFWRRLPRVAVEAVALVALAALVVAPWSMRNQRELGRFVAISTNGGATLLTGNNPTATGDFNPDDPTFKALEARKDLGEIERDRLMKEAGVAWVKANPAQFAMLMPKKLLRLWGPDGEAEWGYQAGYANYAAHEARFRAVRWINQAYYFALLCAFAIAAVVIVLRRWRASERLIGWWLLPYGIAAYPTAIALIFSGQSRFHFPVMPFVCIAAAWLLVEWQSSLARGRGRSAGWWKGTRRTA